MFSPNYLKVIKIKNSKHLKNLFLIFKCLKLKKLNKTFLQLPATDSIQLDYKTVCKINSTSQLTYYFFELHVLLFHLSILSCSSFIQIYFYSKLTMMVVGIAVYIIGFNMHKIYECLAESMQFNLPFLKAELLLQMFFYVIFLHLIDRRVFS